MSPARLFSLYQRKRVININANIVVASLLALALAKFPVQWFGEWVGREHELLIAVVTYVIDLSVDATVYFALHWVANHWKPSKPSSPDTPAQPKPTDETRIKRFIIDALHVQAERAMLVPIFALVAIGGHSLLLHHTDLTIGWAFVLSYLTALCVTRVIHTVVGYRTGSFDDAKHAKKDRIRKRRFERARRKAT